MEIFQGMKYLPGKSSFVALNFSNRTLFQAYCHRDFSAALRNDINWCQVRNSYLYRHRDFSAVLRNDMRHIYFQTPVCYLATLQLCNPATLLPRRQDKAEHATLPRHTRALNPNLTA